MLLSEINGEYQKKRMIVYNADGTKPIVHNIEVAPIFGNIYMSRLEKFRIRWMRSSGKEEKRLRKKWKKPEIFSGFFCCSVSKIKFLSVVIVWRQSAA